MPVPLVMSSPADAVRFAGSPPLRNFTHTSGVPRVFDRYATHFPSGEITGPISWPEPLVSRTMRENTGAASAFDPDGWDESEDAQGLTIDERRYSCGCLWLRQEYHDGSVYHRIVDHHGKVLEDQIIGEHGA